MKMSLCNTFRFFAVSTTIVLSVVGSPVPGLVGRRNNIATEGIGGDLEQQGSLTVELKSSDSGPNYINSLKLNNVKDNTNSPPIDSEGAKKNVNKNSHEEATTQVEDTSSTPVELVTGVLSTTVLNVAFVNQTTEGIVNNTIRDENASPVKISDTTEKEIKIKKNLISQNNNIFNENRTEVPIDTTKNKLEPSTLATSMSTNESTDNENIATETSSSVIDAKSSISDKAEKFMNLPSLANGVTIPSWKKYTVIDRKRVSTSTEDFTTSNNISTDNTENLSSTIFEKQPTVTETSEVMVKSETAQGRVSLQDAITSDIPSLEKLKSDLLSYPKFSTKSNAELTTHLTSTEESTTEINMTPTEQGVTSTSVEENITKIDTTQYITTTYASASNSETPNTVSSKRAGYLDLSSKNDISLKPNGTESLQGPFDAETPDTQDESLDDKVDRRAESQSQLAEDAIKEELLKEELLNDKEEISKRIRDEGKQIEPDIPALQSTQQANDTQLNDKLVKPPQTATDENLSVRPINSDKTKNTMLYPVNPNYKPLKKIEVQPAKPFVRDPDDNSWRNESLSSLGIVFKPKNSSKPFTQVLKNKTETEWNNLPEKDVKSEVPDLRVRLEQIAQKRKSKKKKIDALGNVFYTDYEENTSSEENTSTPRVEPTTFATVPTTDVSTTDITIVTPVPTTSASTSSAPAVGEGVPALTTATEPTEKTSTTPKKELTKVTALKRPKMFNLFDYYETNDDEDIEDYLNMAKIDLKKYTVPLHTTFSPYTAPPLPVLYTTPMVHHSPERKGTIQYFPPRTTKRPKKNRHKTMRDEMSPLTLTDSPKHVLPLLTSYDKTTTPFSGPLYYTEGPAARFREEPKSYDPDPYLTTAPLTTTPDDDFGVGGGRDRRPNYVIKHHAPLERGTRPPAEGTTPPEDYDYGVDYRKDQLDRLVADLDGAPGRFRPDLPVVYNNSIVHAPGSDDRDAAMSRAYFRRPAGGRSPRPDPDCENVTVELSPAYELHYYVPEQEERQEVEPKPLNLPGRYSL